MTETEAIKLIEEADFVSNKPQEWVDLGCGSGLFSHALAKLLPVKSHILMVDKVNQAPVQSPVSGVELEFRQTDFTGKLSALDGVDGILMANSLHYVKDKKPFIQKLKNQLSATGQLIIIEYDTDQSNPWIPYPITINELKKLCIEAGFMSVKKIGERPSRYGHKNMYACVVR